MPHRPTHISQNNHNHRIKVHSSTKHPLQYGIASQTGESNLLGIPAESLTHITSFLPPSSLFSLGRTSKQLHNHVKDDNTWRRAYFCQFLGISPEDDLRDGGELRANRALMVRRMETSWKREFVARWNLRRCVLIFYHGGAPFSYYFSRRYERSRSAPVTHVPVHSAVVDMHLMPNNPAAPTVPPGLLSASLQYGVVARSHPVTGKVLRGYFDAAGTQNGLGVGNPNAEFSPDVSKCALTSDGGTGKILWGLRDGTVAVTTAPKAFDMNRVSVGGKWAKCLPADKHAGSIEDALWAGGFSGHCVTCSIDGRVKLWNGKSMSCLWSSEKPEVHSPCVKVAVDHGSGVIASVTHNGQILVWTGLEALFIPDANMDEANLQVRQFILTAPLRAVAPPPSADGSLPAREISAFYLHPPSDDIVSLISAYHNDTHFYRTTLNPRTGDVERRSYGDGQTGTITALEPVFGSNDTSFVIAGDQLGCVTVYPWTDTCPTSSVIPIHKFEAHGTGSVSAIKWTPTVLVTGSSNGSAEVWDSLDFSHLRSFASVGLRPTERIWDPVSRIIVEKDLVVLSVGTKVMAWLAGPVGVSVRKGKHLKMSAKSNNSVAKWQRAYSFIAPLYLFADLPLA